MNNSALGGNHITIGIKDTKVLCKWLEMQADAERISLSDFTQTFRSTLLFNIEHTAMQPVPKPSANELRFYAYKLTDTPKNRKYTSSLKDTHEKYIYVIFEELTGYILSNSPRLFLELQIERGVSQYDYDHQTELLSVYTSYVQLLHEYITSYPPEL